MATLRSGPALALCLAGLSVVGACMAPAPLPAPEKAAEPARQAPEPRRGWGEPLRDAAVGCVGLARVALATGAGPPGLALRLVGGSAGIDDDLGLAEAIDGSTASCVLIVEAPRALPPEARRLVGRETVRSQYGDGVELVANPVHAQLQRDLAKVERQGGDAARIMATGEPMVDLIGNLAEAVVAGIDKVSRLQQASGLRRDLAASVAEIERPRLRRYSYETVQVEAHRAGLSRVGLQDIGAGTIRETVSSSRETRLFRLDEGRRAEDVGHADDNDDAVDLVALSTWERSPPTMRTSTLLAHLLEVGTERRVTVDELLADWLAAAGETAVVAPAAAVVASLVRIDGGGKEGAGFFVAADRVLTLDRLVRGSDLVRVTTADGRNSYALVERRDKRRGLALLRMPAPATAFTLVADRAVPSDATLAWPDGPPAGARGRLVRDSVKDRLLWQPDAPVQPLDGAPAIVDGEVVAMVAETRDLGATLLPASELRAFLAVAP